jgi:hypothetical protein
MESQNLETSTNRVSQSALPWNASTISLGVNPSLSSDERSAEELALFGKYLCDLLFEAACGNSGHSPNTGEPVEANDRDR